MLICLGGFLGSGRRILARKVANKYGLHLYDAESKKAHLHVFDKNGRVKEVLQRPTTDELRRFLFSRIIEDFPKLAKMYPDMIIHDAFHRAKPRTYFFAEAKKYFDPVVFIWIDSDEAHVEARVRHMQEIGLVGRFETAVQRRKKAVLAFEQLGPDTPVFKCVQADDAEVEALWALIQESVQPSKKKKTRLTPHTAG